MMKQYFCAALVLLAGSASFAWAQAVALPPLRAVITVVTASGIVVTKADGTSADISFSPGLVVLEVEPGSLASVKPGSYIGTAAMKQPDGSYRAIELQIFPASMKGVGLGTHDWNLKPKSTMTNGTVHGLTSAGGTVGAVTSNGDTTLHVNDGSGEKTILLPQGAPVVAFVPGTLQDIKPGAHALIFASRMPDGKLLTGRVNVGVNGLVPPM
jgi:hypothetical protein